MSTDNIIIEALSHRFLSLQEGSEPASKPLNIDKVHVPFDLPKTINARGKANIKAIQLLISKEPSQLTDAERDAIRQYTGWGGFSSVQEWNDQITDPNWIITDDAITYEYYTPYELTYSIRDKILPIIQGKTKDFLPVPKWNGKYLALEGSAGIGRFVDPLYTEQFQWNTIEPAIQSATVLMALYPESRTNISTFDNWAFKNDPIGIYSLVLGNPPYKNRGEEVMQDPSWSDYNRAEHYQLLRTLPMLNKGGLSVMVIPRATMSQRDKANEKVREEMLKYAHLIGAVRLPTHSAINGKLKSALFHNVATPIDVLFLQARGGKLKSVPASDTFIVDGDYFDRYPNHIMGVVNEPNTSVVVGGHTFENKAEGQFARTKIIMDGVFNGLIDFHMRPFESAIKEAFVEKIGEGKTSVKKKKAEKVVRAEEDTILDKEIIETMDAASQAAYHIVPKIQDFIKNIELNTNVSRMEAHAIREGINVELQSFAEKYGNPRKKGMLSSLKDRDPFRYNIFISVFTEQGNPIQEVSKPLALRFEYNGDIKDYGSIFTAWYKHAQKYKQFPILTEKDLVKVRKTLKIDDTKSFEKIAIELSSQGWCLNPSDNHDVYYILPQNRYYEGNLWPKHDALQDFISSDKASKNQVLTEVYKKQLSQLVDPNPETQKSLMDLATFPDLLNDRKILFDSPYVSEALLNKFFKSIYEPSSNIVKGTGKLRTARIKIDNNKYFIEAKVEDILTTFQDLLIKQYSFELVRDEKLVKGKYGGVDILKDTFPSIYQKIEPYIKDSIWEDGTITDMGAIFKRIAVSKRIIDNPYVLIDNDDLRPKASFDSILPSKQQLFFGMLIKDGKIFKATIDTKLYKNENSYGAKVRIRRDFEDSFLDFLGNVEQKGYWDSLTDAYNRMFRGYIEPNYLQGEDIILNGWQGLSLRPYQSEAVRKMAYQKQGLLAFDVGLGKTLTGIATIALAKQQGWCQRPLIVVPNSILFKWKSDILKVLPDWKIVTIGANQFYDKSGNLKSKTDTAEERGEKWLQFSLGAYDVALLTYSMLDRTQFRESTYGDFAMKHLEGESNIYEELAQKRAENKSESKLLQKKQQIETQIAQMLLPPKSQRVFDKGVTWEDIGIDLILIDEAQNFKNLFVPKTDFSPPPKFLGASPASKSSYNLDIRCMQVRKVAQQKYGSNNVFLLSATPAKNSPIEFYNLIQYIDPDIWTQYGIRNSSEFFSKFMYVEHAEFYNSKLEIQEYPQVKSFMNLDDFRALLTRYCTFEVFETIIKRYPEIEKSIKVPAVNNKQVRIDINAEQRRLIDDILWKMGKVDMDEEGNITQDTQVPEEEKISALEGIVKMLAVCVHPILITGRFQIFDEEEEIPEDEEDGKKKKRKRQPVRKMSIPEIEKEIKKINIHSPKLDALVSNVTHSRKDTSKMMGDITCGNIIFIQNIAVQYMIRDLLIKAGIPKYSIGIMNAMNLSDPQSRQNMAEEFNFISDFYVYKDQSLNETEYEALNDKEKNKAKAIKGYKYDIIIANSIAYEGIDLQHRTCAIHHVDLAWESATITQRNGRGVRSGNDYSDVDIYYYIMKNTVDQYIYLTIQGKREWLVSAIESQDREINNLGASETSAESILQITSTSPEDYERRKAIAQKRTEEKKVEKEKQIISSQIKKTSILFTQARTSKDARIKEAAEKALETLKTKDASLFPALYYVDELRYSRAFLFHSQQLYDVVFIKGFMYITGNGSIYMYIDKKGEELQFLSFVMTDGSIWNPSISYKEINQRNLSILHTNLTIPYAYASKQGYQNDSFGALIHNDARSEILDQLRLYLEGTGDLPVNERVQRERKETIYRWLIKNEYINIVDPMSIVAERSKNTIYTSFTKRLLDSNAYHYDFIINSLFQMPRAYIMEMYTQGFFDVMINSYAFLRYIIVKNTNDNSIWVIDGKDLFKNPLVNTSLDKVEKDNFTFYVPKREKYHKKTSSEIEVTSENVHLFLDEEYRKIYEACKKAKQSSGNTIAINDILAQDSSLSSSIVRKRINDMSERILRIFHFVLGLERGYSGSIDGHYFRNIGTSSPMTIDNIVHVNFELFPPNETGFREMTDMVKNGAKIYEGSDFIYDYVAPNMLQRRGKERIGFSLQGKQDSLIKEINHKNEMYFGIGRQQRFSYTTFLKDYSDILKQGK